MPPVITSADIGSAIASARKYHKLSQAKLAAIAGTSQAVVSQIERGKETAQLSIVLALIAAVGLRIAISAPAGTYEPAPEPPRPGNVVFDEPLPDDSIDLDAIVGSSKPKAVK
jgi:transcriptional regulator with XRE-family HTH domain